MTARYLCSVTLNSHSMSGSVKYQAKPTCKASSGTHTSGHVCEDFLYGFKGARSAPGRGWPPSWEAPRAEPADRSTASNRPSLVAVTGGP